MDCIVKSVSCVNRLSTVINAAFIRTDEHRISKFTSGEDRSFGQK